MEFKQLPIPEKTVFGKNVYEQMLGNVGTYDKPDVALEDLLKTNNKLFDAAEAAKTGDFQKVAAMHAAEKEWDATYTTQAHYVDRVAKGQKEIILLSGFKATSSETKPATQCAAATGLKVTPNTQTSGAAHVECDPIPGAVVYIFIVTSSPANIVFKNSQLNTAENKDLVNAIVDTHRKVDFVALPGGTNLWVRVIGVNSVGMGIACSPVSFKVMS